MKSKRTISSAMTIDQATHDTSPIPSTGDRASMSEGERSEHERVLALSPVAPAPPDPEVEARPARRKYTAAYKLRILQQADSCSKAGEIGALLRREGLYSSHLVKWRKQREAGDLIALSPQKRGRKEQAVNPLAREVARLQRENDRLQARLKQAETIIEVQKKVAQLLGIPLAENGEQS